MLNQAQLNKAIAMRTAQLMVDENMAPGKAKRQATTETESANSAELVAAEIATALTAVTKRLVEHGVKVNGKVYDVDAGVLARIFRHVEDDATVGYAGKSHHNRGGAADSQPTSDDFGAVGIKRIRVGKLVLPASRGNFAKLLREAFRLLGEPYPTYSESAPRYMRKSKKIHQYIEVSLTASGDKFVSLASMLAKFAK